MPILPENLTGAPETLKLRDKRNGKTITLKRKPWADTPVGGYNPYQVANAKPNPVAKALKNLLT